jgi:hypothetical protein
MDDVYVDVTPRGSNVYELREGYGKRAADADRTMLLFGTASTDQKFSGDVNKIS